MAKRDFGIKTTDGQRLVWWKKTADEQFWHEHFSKTIELLHKKGMGEPANDLIYRLMKIMPKEGRIIEAGCGVGWIVAALLKHGYGIEGTDYSKELIDKVLSIYPNLPVKTGNALAFNVPDGYYKGYISIGVIEHRFEGCEPFLKEAHRVVAPGGMLYITVPHFNRLRKNKVRSNPPQPQDLPFYQYGFDDTFYRRELEKIGFRVIRFEYYGSWRGVQEDLPLVYNILSRRYIKQIAVPLIEKLDNQGWLTHTIAAVVQRP